MGTLARNGLITLSQAESQRTFQQALQKVCFHHRHYCYYYHCYHYYYYHYYYYHNHHHHHHDYYYYCYYYYWMIPQRWNILQTHAVFGKILDHGRLPGMFALNTSDKKVKANKRGRDICTKLSMTAPEISVQVLFPWLWTPFCLLVVSGKSMFKVRKIDLRLKSLFAPVFCLVSKTWDKRKSNKKNNHGQNIVEKYTKLSKTGAFLNIFEATYTIIFWWK